MAAACATNGQEHNIKDIIALYMFCLHKINPA